MPNSEIVYLTHEAPVEVRDAEQRLISGRIVPYNEQILVRGRPESFAPGSLSGVNPERVRLLDHHDQRKPIGKMVSLEERSDGAYATFQIARTERGDEILQLVIEGVLDSFSPGFVPGVQDANGVHQRIKDLPEVSLVTFPAYAGAKVLSVREEAIVPVDETQTESNAVTLDPEALDKLQKRQEEMFSTLTKLQAAIESGNVQTRNAPKPPTRLEWFRAQFARNYDNDPGPWEALQKRWEEFKEYAAEHAPEKLQTRALADITGGETQAGDNTPPDDLSGLVVEEFLASQLVNVLDARRPFFRRLGSFPAVRSGYVRIPTITQHTAVDKRAGQKQEANSQAMIVTTSAFEAEWYDGAVDIALEIIRTAELDVLNLVYNDLLGVYAKRIETATIEKVEAGGLGFTYTGAPLRTDSYANFITDVVTWAIEVREATDLPATRLAVTKDQWIALLALVDANSHRQFAPGDRSDASATLTAESLVLPGGIEVFYAPNLTQAVMFNEAAFRAVDYGPERVEAVNVAQMGRDLGVLGRAMWVPRIPSGVIVFGDDPEES